jgi:hypothetical protein
LSSNLEELGSKIDLDEVVESASIFSPETGKQWLRPAGISGAGHVTFKVLTQLFVLSGLRGASHYRIAQRTMIDNSGVLRRRRAKEFVTQNACNECRKKRAKVREYLHHRLLAYQVCSAMEKVLFQDAHLSKLPANIVSLSMSAN